MYCRVTELSFNSVWHGPGGLCVNVKPFQVFFFQIGKRMDNSMMRKFESWASIYLADGRLTARYREVSKSRNSGLDFSNRSAIWQAPQQQHCREAYQI